MSENRIDIARQVELALETAAARSRKPGIVGHVALSRHLSERGLIRRETCNIVRPLSSHGLRAFVVGARAARG